MQEEQKKHADSKQQSRNLDKPGVESAGSASQPETGLVRAVTRLTRLVDELGVSVNRRETLHRERFEVLDEGIKQEAQVKGDLEHGYEALKQQNQELTEEIAALRQARQLAADDLEAIIHRVEALLQDAREDNQVTEG